VRPGVGKRHLEGPRNPGELNLGTYVFEYVYKVHKWTCMLGGGMRPGLTAFFSVTYFFFQRRKAKDMNVKLEPRTRMEIDSELHRLSINGTKLLVVFKAIIIIICIIKIDGYFTFEL